MSRKFCNFAKYMPLTLIIGLILRAVLALGILWQILRSEKEPDLQLLWLVSIALFPVIGLVVYCLCGINYRRDVVRERLHARSWKLFSRMPEESGRQLFPESIPEQVEERFRPLARMLRACGDGNRVYEGNSMEIITSGLRKREILLEDIRKAQKFIHIEYFRFGNDKAGKEVRDALLQKVKEGVEVRFLNNNMIGRDIPRSYFRNMRKGGIEVLPYTHIRNGFRSFLMRINCQNHRKIVVIDGTVAYTGGMNLNDNYFFKWRDTHLRIEGPVVARLQASFIDSWVSSGGRLSRPLAHYFPLPVPSGWEAPFKDQCMQVVTDAAENRHPATLLGYEWILQNARDYVYIHTPYFIPPTSFLNALKSAALRGVDVRVMLPRRVDTPLIGPANRSVYAECLAAGVHILERNGEFIHSKTLVCDDGLTIVGASNLDMRSFFTNSEVNSFIYDKETALFCKAHFLEDAEGTREWTLESWKNSRTWYQEMGSHFMRLFYRLL